MVGDGINHAAALAAADIGIAVATATGAAMAAADITLVHGGVGADADAVSLAHATRWTIRQILGWGFGYNLLLVPLAAAGILPPVLAALAMATSSVTVVRNALRLHRIGKASGDRGTPPRHGMVTPRSRRPPGYQPVDEPGHRRIGPARADRPSRRKSPCRMRPRDGSCVLTINAACASLVEGTCCEVGGGYGLAA
jgi:Cu+-exporting ATPase